MSNRFPPFARAEGSHEKRKTMNKINYEKTPHGTIRCHSYGAAKTMVHRGQAVEGQRVYLHWLPDEGYRLEEAHYTDANGEVTPISLEACSFVMPGHDITIGGTFEKATY